MQEISAFSFYVNLPKVWLQHHKIKKRDLISMEIDENQNLILKPFKNDTTKELEHRAGE